MSRLSSLTPLLVGVMLIGCSTLVTPPLQNRCRNRRLLLLQLRTPFWMRPQPRTRIL